MGPRISKIDSSGLCVTQGEVRDAGSGKFEVDSPAMRAVVAGSDPAMAELRFLYKGPTSETRALANGEVRRQVALKLRAEDSCNVVYVVWRFEPESKVVVQTKKNPGKHRHRECGDEGYETIAARHVKRVAAPAENDEHRLEARLRGDELQVVIDGELVWEGDLASKADFTGPVGVRTDTTRHAFPIGAVPGRERDCARYADAN